MVETTPVISFILPVYNKAAMLPAALTALALQDLPAGQAEYLFVDDGSSDGSPSLIEAWRPSLPGVRLITNPDNRGPAARLNQGAALARGSYLCLMDSDDLIAPDAARVGMALLRKHEADCLLGRVHRLAGPGVGLPAIGEHPNHAVSNAPLRTVLGGRGYTRMAWITTTALFHRAGGCDERLFCQDESLALRLAAKAGRFIDLRADIIEAPTAADGGLSGHRRQQWHDRFWAHYLMLRDHPELPEDLRRQLVRRCLSSAWKAVRAQPLSARTLALLVDYLRSRSSLGDPLSIDLGAAADLFTAMAEVRRPAASR